MPQATPGNKLSCGRKRKRVGIEVVKSSHSPRLLPLQTEKEEDLAYWDTLSKLWLTPSALRELDRRNKKLPGPDRIATSCKPVREPDLIDYQPQQLKRFARYGGPDLCDLRGYSEPAKTSPSRGDMPGNKSTSGTQSIKIGLNDSTTKTTSSKAKTISAYDPNFEQRLIDSGIYPDDFEFLDERDPPKPDNEGEILERLRLPRRSLSPSQFPEKAFRHFKQKYSRALDENDMMRDVFPAIEGNTSIPSGKNKFFNNLEPLTRYNLVHAKPDSYDGARPNQIHQRIRDEIGSYIIPLKMEHAPALPNFFVEVKGPDGSAAVARRQACYDGAIGVRAMHKLQSFGDQPKYSNNAYTITSTLSSGLLTIYTVHLIQATDPANPPEYYMTQLRSISLLDSPAAFRESASVFRNARDWAKEQRDTFITAANGRVAAMPTESIIGSSSIHMTQSTVRPMVSDSNTSNDELVQGVDRPSSPAKKRPRRESAKPSTNPGRNLRSKNSHAGGQSRSRSRGRRSQIR